MMADCPSAGRISAQLGSAVNNTTVSHGPEMKHYLPFSQFSIMYTAVGWRFFFFAIAFVLLMYELRVQLTPLPCSNDSAPLIWKHFIPIRHYRTFRIAAALTHLSLAVFCTLCGNKTVCGSFPK